MISNVSPHGSGLSTARNPAVTSSFSSLLSLISPPIRGLFRGSFHCPQRRPRCLAIGFGAGGGERRPRRPTRRDRLAGAQRQPGEAVLLGQREQRHRVHLLPPGV